MQLAKYTALEQQVVLYVSLAFPKLTLFLTCRLLHKCTHPRQPFRMFDRLWITLSLHHASIYVPLEDEITRSNQLSELQREEIIGV